MLKPLVFLALFAFAASPTASAQRCHEIMAEADDHRIGNTAPFASISSQGMSSCQSWAFYKVWMEPDGQSPKMTRHVVRQVTYRPAFEGDPAQIVQLDTRQCGSIIPAAEALRQADVPTPYTPSPDKPAGPLTVVLDGAQYTVSFNDLVFSNGERPHYGSLRYSVHSSDDPVLEDWWRTHAPRLRECIVNNPASDTSTP